MGVNRGETIQTVKDKIIKEFQRSGFSLCSMKPNDDLCFESDFAFYFVFLVESASQLRLQWKNLHLRLIDHYREYEGPEDREWNYYALFVLLDESISNQELIDIKIAIEGDTKFSRKFILAKDELDVLPPGMLSEEDLSAKGDKISDPFEQWEKILGRELIDLICKGPKKTIEDRIRRVIDGEE